MEWIRISANKLKIMLSAEDARRYALNCENADYADLMTREAFREILTDVRQETGFDATEDKVYIQMYPSKEGGCEMYVTKLAMKGLKAADGNAKRSHALLPLSRRYLAFSFDTLNELIGVCRRLLSIDFSGCSEAYLTSGGRYLLIIDEPEENAYIGLCEHSFIDEFGRRENVRNVKLMTSEHTSCICKKNAVEILGVL